LATGLQIVKQFVGKNDTAVFALNRVSNLIMSLEMIIGPMFAGKSSALQSIVRRRGAIGWSVLVIKHKIDTRYVSGDANAEIVNHDKQRCPAIAYETLTPVLQTSEYLGAQMVIIEEGQFFQDLVEFLLVAVEKDNKHVVVVGLDGDAHRKPFPQIAGAMSLADDVQRLFALCKMCGDGTPARFTCAMSVTAAAATEDGKPFVGDDQTYQPLCRRHFLQYTGNKI
jgi:thymidine kinase